MRGTDRRLRAVQAAMLAVTLAMGTTVSAQPADAGPAIDFGAKRYIVVVGGNDGGESVGRAITVPSTTAVNNAEVNPNGVPIVAGVAGGIAVAVVVMLILTDRRDRTRPD